MSWLMWRLEWPHAASARALLGCNSALNHNRVLDVTWKSAVLPDAPGTPPTAEQIVEEMLVSRRGWLERPSGRSVFLKGSTVKQLQATFLQLGPLRAARQNRYATICTKHVVVHCSLMLSKVLYKLSTALCNCWKLRWDNEFKEVHRRWALDGLPTAAQMHMQASHVFVVNSAWIMCITCGIVQLH